MAEIARLTINRPPTWPPSSGRCRGRDSRLIGSERVREALRDWKMKRALQLQELASLKADIDRGLTDLPKAGCGILMPRAYIGECGVLAGR